MTEAFLLRADIFSGRGSFQRKEQFPTGRCQDEVEQRQAGKESGERTGSGVFTVFCCCACPDRDSIAVHLCRVFGGRRFKEEDGGLRIRGRKACPENI